MRIVYMGTPVFAVAPLERLYVDGHDVVGVFTQPDKPRGRGMLVSYSPVKSSALAHGTHVYQPQTLKDGSTAEIISSLKCDVVVAVAYGKLLPKDLLILPPFGCINIHASLLPKYRGAAPIQWAILNGEKETGVTSMFMSEELDSGDIIFSRKTQIGENETAGMLHDRLSIHGAILLSETISALAIGVADRIPQDHDAATFAPHMTKSMSKIDWADCAINIKRKVYGLNPWPAATVELGGKTCKVYDVEIQCIEHVMPPGEIVKADNSGVVIACKDGFVEIKELQAPGGRRMRISEYLRGHAV